MALPNESIHPMTADEYLTFEQSAATRHEFVDGYLYAMVGASRNHGLIAANVLFTLQRVRGRKCRVFASDMKVQVSTARFYYPDIVVACGEPPEDQFFEDRPCLIVEILSPTTEQVDRREKRVAYQGIPGLQTYLIVEQDSRFVQRHYRDDTGDWRAEIITDGPIPVSCPPGASLTVDDVYNGVDV